jgi:hypothetical protein
MKNVDIASLMNDLEKSVKELLVKADPGEEAPGEETPSGSSLEGSSPGAPPEGSPPAGAPEGSAPPEGSPPEGSPEGSVEELKNAYMTLDIEDLKAHFAAVHAALEEKSGGGDAAPGQEGPPPGAGPEGTPPEGAGADAGGPPPGEEPPAMGKSEIPESIQIQLAKAEKLELELTEIKKSLAEKDAAMAAMEVKFEQQINTVAEGFQKILTKGLRKSAPGISAISKPGTTATEKSEIKLTKSEIVEKLRNAARQNGLSKSERNEINGYFDGSVGVEKLTKFLA